MQLLRANALHTDFIALVAELDKELAIIDGDDHAFFSTYNKTVDIHHTVIAYIDTKPVGIGAIKHYDATRYAAPYAGVIAFTGGLIGKEIDETRYGGNFGDAKVFIGNSDQDPHVPEQRSVDSKNLMEKLGAHVNLQIYPGMPHTITVREINDVKNFMF